VLVVHGPHNTASIARKLAPDQAMQLVKHEAPALKQDEAADEVRPAAAARLPACHARTLLSL
jgi:hypothetical protein